MSALPHDHTDRRDRRPTRENRVNRHNPCAWCGDTSYCLQFDDGGSFCRTEGLADQWTDAYMGGYIHRVRDTPSGPAPRPLRAPPRASVVEAADVDTQHAVYTSLRALCPLSAAHHALLTGPGHGLSHDQAGLYGTLPASATTRREIVDALLREHTPAAVLGTPGFIRDDAGRIALAPLAGVLMPRRDLRGCLTGVMVRSDKADADPRYLWLSSAAAGGPSPGSSPHLARPPELRQAGVVYIVEGIKKADLIAARLGCLAISINGVGTWRAAEEILDALADQGVDICIIALDRDVKAAAIAHVERSRQRLAAAAVARGYGARVAVWEKEVAKGPDDLLLAGHTFTVERYRPQLRLVPNPDGDDPGGETDTGTDSPLVGAPTIEEALALPHPTLARRYVDAKARLRAADDTLAYIARVAKHQAVITPGDDPEAKRTRPILSATDRIIGIDYALEMRAAGKGLIPREPVPLWRGQIAAAVCASPSTVTTSTKQLARVGLLHVTPAPGDREANLFALPATMPGDIAPENLIDFESGRRRKERLRRCSVCGGTRFKQTTTCMSCGNIEEEIIGEEENAGEGVGATCTPKDSSGRESIQEGEVQRKGGVGATCTHPSVRRDTAQRDRAARNGHRASRDDIPRQPESDDEVCEGDRRGPGPTAAAAAATPVVERLIPLALPLPPPVDTAGARVQVDDGPPTELCRTCGAVHYRWSERMGGWVCARCWPAPVKGVPVKGLAVKGVPGRLHIPDSSAATTAAVWEGLTDDD